LRQRSKFPIDKREAMIERRRTARCQDFLTFEEAAMKCYQVVLGSAIALVSFMGPALAGAPPTPGPIAGIGLPALAVIGGAYWIGRKIFVSRRKR
jgi:hypothetical protein